MKKIVLSALAFTVILASCGNEKPVKQEEVKITKEEVKIETPEKEEVSEEKTTLELSSNDQMKYDKSEMTVKAGQEVTLTLTHTGTMAKTVMGHNFVLLKQGVEIKDFAMKAMKAKDNDYIPEGDDVIAHTGVIGGGETTSVTFTAPEKGTYDYICSFPGHFGMMFGKLIVE